MPRRLLLGFCALALLFAGACASSGPALEALVPSPGAALHDGEVFEYAITEPGREPVRGTLRATKASNGWTLSHNYRSETNATNADLSEVTTDDALRTRSSERSIEFSGSLEGHALDYNLADRRVTSTRVKAGKIETRELKLRDNAYDNDSAFWLWRSLPLAEGYTARYNSVNSYERSQSLVTLSVVGRAEVTAPAGTIDAWRVLVVSGRASRTAWIEVAPPHRLVQWDNGAAIMQLTASR
ncbi:MAG: DUF3108 domain-containing protein [Dehalococcoidia bacterium]|nr:DUF3108 domain-containing protein [Dehalococcoidia bacterium]